MEKKRIGLILGVLVLAAVIVGSRHAALNKSEAGEPAEQQIPEATQQIPETEEPASAYTYPPDGNPEDITCLGSYTTDGNPDRVVARLNGEKLTNRQLRAWYSLTAAQYRASGKLPQPDWSIPLDAQRCPADETLGSWQQFFLERALHNWHSAQALSLQGEQEGVPKERAYQPSEVNHKNNLQDIPATRFLYGYYDNYVPNTMHQAYLDEIPALLEQLASELGFESANALAEEAVGTDLASLTEAVELYNLAYMYLTTLSYDLTPSEDAVQALLAEQSESGEEICVDFRHILLIPEEGTAEDGSVITREEALENCLLQAQELLEDWAMQSGRKESAFAQLAYENSKDRRSAVNGGGYTRVTRGQLLEVLDNWCFDPDRKRGDTAVLTSEEGCHVVYFAGSEPVARAEARDALKAEIQAGLISAAREKYPVQVNYRNISLAGMDPLLTMDAVLYPDVAHERFPEVPLYLQQDYPSTMYGAYPVASHGCGITSMAMLATYMTDDELTVPEMCNRFGQYCLDTGTNHAIFRNEPAGMGFFLREFTSDPEAAKEALRDGYIVVSLQHKGYWTFGGHFIVIEKITEDDMVQVRDSNLFNFGRLQAHKQDLHAWSCIPPRSAGYWIYEKKVTSIPDCERCGQPEEGSVVQEYCCEKCRTALLRRENYLACLQ